MPTATERAAGTRRSSLRAKTTDALAAVTVLVLLTTACAAGETPAPTTSGAETPPEPTVTPAATSPPETPASETSVSVTEPPTTTEPPTMTAAPSTTTSMVVTTVPLPGEPSDFGPIEGAVLAVVGVDHDDVLNVRDVPAGEIIATLGLLNPYVGVLAVREAPSGEVLAASTPGRAPSWPPAGPDSYPPPPGTS